MNKSIIDNLSDNEVKIIAEKCSTFKEFTKELGYKQKDVGKNTRNKIKNRLLLLNISFKKINKKETAKNISHYKNSKSLGFVGEKAFEFDCARKELNFYKETTENEPFDYILELSSGFKKIQVKTTEFIKNGTAIFYINCGNFYYSKNKKSKQSAYYSKDIDFLYLYCVENNEGYFYEINKNEEFIPRAIYIRIDPPKNNQLLNCHPSKEFLFKNKIDLFIKKED